MSSRRSVVATIVAERGSPSIRLISPKKSPGWKGDSYRLREKNKAGLLGRKPKPAAELEEGEVGAEA